MGFWAALEFLTVIPSPYRHRPGQKETGRSLVYFPLVGLLLGLLLWGLDSLLRLIVPLPLVSALLIGAMVGLTGALHLDGFMDTCDGLGGHTSQARLEIMRDSRVGAFGVVGVVALLLVKYGALVSLSPIMRPAALVLAPVLGRWAMVFGVSAYPYARDEGLGMGFAQQANWTRFGVATAATLGLAFVVGHWAGLATFGVVGVLVWGVATFLKGKFNGLTGDNYGALGELAEVVSLILMILWQE